MCTQFMHKSIGLVLAQQFEESSHFYADASTQTSKFIFRHLGLKLLATGFKSTVLDLMHIVQVANQQQSLLIKQGDAN